MPEEIQQLQMRLLVLENLLFALIKSDKYYFGKHVTFANGVIIDAGTGSGLKIGRSATQKLSVYGVGVVAQAGAIASPSGGTTVDAQARTAIDSIRTALTNFGITA